MSKKSLFLMLAAALTWAACEKDPQPAPDNNDTTGGEQPTVVEKNVYSVSADKQVTMAKGNLQYQASTDTWRIAPNAWDAAKDGNCQTSAVYAGWIDNFGWATSGYDNYHPYLTINSASQYYTGGNIDGTEYDWGVHNAILNGETLDPAGTWRTLSSQEWEYLVNHRAGSTLNGVENARYSIATVNGQKGIILFPDVFAMPESVAPPRAASINEPATYATNVYSAEDWALMEEAGCVFMPSAGCVNVADNSMVSVDYLGCYWSSTFVGAVEGMIRAGQLWFNPYQVETASAGVQYRRSVRLAKDLK